MYLGGTFYLKNFISTDNEFKNVYTLNLKMSYTLFSVFFKLFHTYKESL